MSRGGLLCLLIKEEIATLRTIKTAATRLIAAFSALSAVPAMAASADRAFQKGSDAINWVFLGLTGMSVVTISCAVAFIAYKMLC